MMGTEEQEQQQHQQSQPASPTRAASQPPSSPTASSPRRLPPTASNPTSPTSPNKRKAPASSTTTSKASSPTKKAKKSTTSTSKPKKAASAPTAAAATSKKQDISEKTFQFPLARVKKIIKEDRDVYNCAGDAAVMVSYAAEMFLELLAEKAYDYARKDKRKGIAYKDLAAAVKNVDQFEFLSDVIPPTVPLNQALEKQKKVQPQQPTEQAATIDV